MKSVSKEEYDHVILELFEDNDGNKHAVMTLTPEGREYIQGELLPRKQATISDWCDLLTAYTTSLVCDSAWVVVEDMDELAISCEYEENEEGEITKYNSMYFYNDVYKLAIEDIMENDCIELDYWEDEEMV